LSRVVVRQSGTDDLPAQAGPVFAPGELAGKVMRQCHEVTALKEQFFGENQEKIVACSQEMARAFDKGGRLFAMGNGGSSCDAIHLSVEFMHPIITKRPPLPTISLTTDMAILTAIGNDQDFSMIYAQQLKCWEKPGIWSLACRPAENPPTSTEPCKQRASWE